MGRPSGTATIMMIMTVVRISHTLFKVFAKSQFSAATIEMIMLITAATKIIPAAKIPHFVKVPAMFSSLIWSGVLDDVSNLTSFIPLLLFTPTAQTTALPLPETIKDWDRTNGSGSSLKFSSVRGPFLALRFS